MKNMKIRQEIFVHGLKMWQVAEVMQVHPNTLTNWLRQELTGERLERVQNAIESLSNGGVQ